MAPIRHQQIGEGEAFVEPRSVDTARGLLAAAEELGYGASVVRTQQGGYLAPVDVVEKWQEGDTGDAEVTMPDEPEPTPEPEEESGPPAESAGKQEWFDYAVSQGFEGEYDSITKPQLIERYGATE